MADFTKLNADLADLATKVQALVAENAALKANPPLDEQPAVDTADAAVTAISASIPTA